MAITIDDPISLCLTRHKHKHHVGLSGSIIPPVRNIVGCRIKHKWKEDCNSPLSHWSGTVLDQIPVNPSLYLIKYDGFECVYGLEIFRDERVQGLEVLPDKIGMYFQSNIKVQSYRSF